MLLTIVIQTRFKDDWEKSGEKGKFFWWDTTGCIGTNEITVLDGEIADLSKRNSTLNMHFYACPKNIKKKDAAQMQQQ